MALTDTDTLQKVADPPAGEPMRMNTKISPKVERPERRILRAASCGKLTKAALE